MGTFTWSTYSTALWNHMSPTTVMGTPAFPLALELSELQVGTVLDTGSSTHGPSIVSETPTEAQ